MDISNFTRLKQSLECHKQQVYHPFRRQRMPKTPLPNEKEISKEKIEFALKINGKLFNLQNMEERKSPFFNSQRFIFLRTLLRFSQTRPKWNISLQNSLLPIPNDKDFLKIARNDEKSPNRYTLSTLGNITSFEYFAMPSYKKRKKEGENLTKINATKK